MSPYQRALTRPDTPHDVAITTSPSSHDYAMLEELSFVRREAQAEADQAYEDWRVRSSRDAYAVYRAAQDRADAAQDDLANLVAQLSR